MAFTKKKVAKAKHKKYIVQLTQQEREQLTVFVASKASKVKRRLAQVLLMADIGDDEEQGWTDELIAEVLGCSTRTTARTRKRFVLEGLESCLKPKPRKPFHRLRKIDGAAEARLIALACGDPPEGRARWTCRLLADKAIELEIIPNVSHKTVWETLKKTNCSLI